MKTNKIRILVVRVGQPAVVEEHDLTLEVMQRLVGGYVESVDLGGGIFMSCNEEGKLQGLAPNFALPGDLIVGDVFFCRIKDSNEASLTDADIKRIRAKLGR
jgi:hypothetical protein